MALTYIIAKIITDENNNTCNIVIQVSNGEKAKVTITKEELQDFLTLLDAKTYIKTKIANVLKQKEMFNQIVTALKTSEGKEII